MPPSSCGSRGRDVRGNRVAVPAAAVRVRRRGEVCVGLRRPMTQTVFVGDRSPNSFGVLPSRSPFSIWQQWDRSAAPLKPSTGSPPLPGSGLRKVLDEFSAQRLFRRGSAVSPSLILAAVQGQDHRTVWFPPSAAGRRRRRGRSCPGPGPRGRRRRSAATPGSAPSAPRPGLATLRRNPSFILAAIRPNGRCRLTYGEN